MNSPPRGPGWFGEEERHKEAALRGLEGRQSAPLERPEGPSFKALLKERLLEQRRISEERRSRRLRERATKARGIGKRVLQEAREFWREARRPKKVTRRPKRSRRVRSSNRLPEEGLSG